MKPNSSGAFGKMQKYSETESSIMQFLTVSIRKEGAAVADPYLRQAEIERARELYSQGSIRQLWHRADALGACVLWEAEDESHMRELLSSLPFVQAGCVDVTVLSLRPYSGFGPNGNFPLGALHHEKQTESA